MLRMTIEESADVISGNLDKALARFEGSPGNMRGDKGILRFQQRVVCLGRFLRHHIGTVGFDPSCFQGLSQCEVIDKRATPCIDEDGLRVHPVYGLIINKVVGIRSERTMQRDDIRSLKQILKVSLLDALRQCLCLFAGKGFHFHAKGQCYLGDATADITFSFAAKILIKCHITKNFVV